MNQILTVLRVVLGLLSISLAGLSGIILFSGLTLEGLEDYIIFFGLTVALSIVGIGAILIKKLDFRRWLKIVALTFLGVNTLFFSAFFIQNNYEFRYFVTTAYMLFLTLAYAWSALRGARTFEHQAIFIAVFILMTLVQVTFGMIESTGKAALLFIMALFFIAWIVYPRMTRAKIDLLFGGNYEKLRKRLVPRLIPHDAVLLAYSYLYNMEMLKFEESMTRIRKTGVGHKAMNLYMAYAFADLSIQKGFFTGEVKGLRDYFEQMVSLNKKMFRSKYPMASTYGLMYLMGFYEEDESFLDKVINEMTFEKAYDFKNQPETFYKHLDFEQKLFNAALAYKSGKGSDCLNSILDGSVHPIYNKKYFEALERFDS